MSFKVGAALMLGWFVLLCYVLVTWGAVLFSAVLCGSLGLMRFLLGMGLNICGWDPSLRNNPNPDAWGSEPGRRPDILLGAALVAISIALGGAHFGTWELPSFVEESLRSGRGF